MTQYGYTESEFESFGWNPIASLPLAESYGLDYESAREATPRWYGVSSGIGNNGVSHSWPSYYCRTADPRLLACAAIVDRFKPSEGYRWCASNVEIDGEADYTISTTIYDPPGDDDESGEESDEGSWSNVNGAWLIVEVFPVDDDRGTARTYDSLADCFDDAVLAIAATI